MGISLDGGLDMYAGLDSLYPERINGKDCRGRKIKSIHNGLIYEIEEMEVCRSNAKVKLVGYERWFNTCLFEDIGYGIYDKSKKLCCTCRDFIECNTAEEDFCKEWVDSDG